MPTGQVPQTTNCSQQIVANMNNLNQKVDDLSAALGNLTIGDDLRQNFDQQLASIRNQIQHDVAGATRSYKPKTRKIDLFTGKTQTLRSFLTAIELQMEDDNVIGDEAKVLYVARYLKDDPWEWFEPIARERKKPRREWSDRAERILSFG
jgi:hypothetical protein